jgi:dTDP-4-dehydrorhamnose 3,5-epimerase
VKFSATRFAGVTVIEPEVLRDARGFFLETFHAEKYAAGGIDVTFVQDNHSRSGYGTIRGLHAQRPHPQGKLVRCLAGAIFDVVVDIRRGSPSYLEWLSFELSAENFRQLYIPAGYAHGICVISEAAEIEYKCTDFYSPQDELRIAWNDAAIGIAWPVCEPRLSGADTAARPAAEQVELLPLLEEHPG